MNGTGQTRRMIRPMYEIRMTGAVSDVHSMLQNGLSTDRSMGEPPDVAVLPVQRPNGR